MLTVYQDVLNLFIVGFTGLVPTSLSIRTACNVEGAGPQLVRNASPLERNARVIPTRLAPG